LIKTLISLLAASAAFAHASFAFSQTSATPVTRASVVAEMTQLQKEGYQAESDHNAYPRNIQAAEARLVAQNDTSSYGLPSEGAVASGSRQDVAQPDAMHSLYRGH
jgi:hypothetical protein